MHFQAALVSPTLGLEVGPSVAAVVVQDSQTTQVVDIVLVACLEVDNNPAVEVPHVHMVDTEGKVAHRADQEVEDLEVDIVVVHHSRDAPQVLVSVFSPFPLLRQEPASMSTPFHLYQRA